MGDSRGRQRWKRVRRQALDRDGWRCRHCGRAGRLEVDHVVPIHKGGAAYDLGNLQALCRPCHFAKSTIDRGGTPHVPDEAWQRLTAELLEPNPRAYHR